MSSRTRLCRFAIVGAAGFAVQIVCLQALIALGLHYLVATALAVEAAIPTTSSGTPRGRGATAPRTTPTSGAV